MAEFKVRMHWVFRLATLMILPFLVWGCSGPQGINYAQVSCDPFPHLKVFKRPGPKENLKGRACFLYQSQGYEIEEEKELAGLVFQALRHQGLFDSCKWAGLKKAENVERFCQGVDYLVVLESFEVLAPTKIVPGRIGLALGVYTRGDSEPLWLVGGSWELCPEYSRDYYVTLTRGHAPAANLSITRPFYFLSYLLTEMLSS